jgi:predicted ABC-type ATPase
VPDPVLHIIVGPNGAGKSTLHGKVIGPVTHLDFVNADVIARENWPDEPEARSYEAAELAAERRAALINHDASFVTETVFSHESKLTLLRDAIDAGYLVTCHVLVIPVELAVARVANRAQAGGHLVPEGKIRSRYDRLWPLVGEAIGLVERAVVYDNSRPAPPFRVIAVFEHGAVLGEPDWPSWSPEELQNAGR